MSARKLAMITFRVLQLVFLALVVVGVLFDPGFRGGASSCRWSSPTP